MIQETITYRCTRCSSENIVRNGTTPYGKQQYKCKDCGRYSVLEPSVKYTPEEREQILAAYQERSSMRGIQRVYGTSRKTLSKWLKKKADRCQLTKTLLEVESGDVLELDEVWTFVYRRDDKRWLWTALCRRTLQIVAWVSGDHSAKTCRKLWNLIPQNYQRCHSFSDFWDAYAKVFPKATHRLVGKESGQTCHMERWNCTLRQRMARFVRETLSFSKSDQMHNAAINCFVYDYNLSRISMM